MSESFSSFGYTLIPILMLDIGCVKLVQTCVNLHRPQRFNFCKILGWLGPPFMFIINFIPSRQPTDLPYVLQTFRVEQHRRGPRRDSVWKACSSKRDFRKFLFYLQFTFMFLSGWTEIENIQCWNEFLSRYIQQEIRKFVKSIYRFGSSADKFMIIQVSQAVAAFLGWNLKTTTEKFRKTIWRLLKSVCGEIAALSDCYLK